MVSLHLLQLAFSERKCSASGKILYEVWSQFLQWRFCCSAAVTSVSFLLLRAWSTARNVTVRS